MERNSITEIKYVTPKFHHRVFANLMDFILFALVTLGLFIGIRAIVTHTPDYIAKEDEILSIRKESGMYHVEGTKSLDIVSFIDADTTGYTGYAKKAVSRDVIDHFIKYVGDKAGAESQKKVQDSYDTYRLGADLKYEGVPYFVKNDAGEIVENKECAANNEAYFHNAYGPYIDNYCQAYLITEVPGYLELGKWESATLFAGELLPAYLAGGILAYFVPTLFFRRGRMTIGKWMYRIGVADSNLLVPSFGRSFARFAIFYFAELILSPFTFAIPFLISFSLMAFSKKKQGLADYMLGLYEVDCSKSKLYFSKSEILLEGVNGEKKPVDFHPEYED